MKSHPGVILASLVLISLCCPGRAESPRIARVQGPGEVITAWGAGFDSSAHFTGWSIPFDKESAEQALRNFPDPGVELARLAPPPGAVRLKVLQNDERGFTASLFVSGGLFHQPHLLVATNSAGSSPTVAIAGARLWMAYPERVSVGGYLRLFGVDLARRLVAIRSKEDGRLTFLELSRMPSRARNSRYELDFHLPEEIKPGAYEILAHNGRGGPMGWSRPLDLTVVPSPTPAPPPLNARDFGVRGDGLNDDSDALRAALQVAKDKGQPLHLPPGRYPISKLLWIPEGVELRGAGRDQTTVFVRDEVPMEWDVPDEVAKAMPAHFRARQKEGLSAMLWMRDGSALTDLTLEDGPGVLQGIYVAPLGVRIERCRLLMKSSPQPAITVEWGSHRFVLRECEITSATAGLFMTHGPNVQAYIGYNVIRPHRHGYPLQAANNMVIRGPERSLIEENDLSWGDRNLCFQTSGGSSSSLHTVVLGNRLNHGSPRRHNAGEFMIESDEFSWTGPAESATATTISAIGHPLNAQGKWAPLQRHAAIPGQTQTVLVILDGRGIGQFRHILKHDDKTVTVDRPWDVVPDRTSYFGIGRAYVENLWIDNTDEGTANWTGFWGVNIGHVVDGLIHRRGMGFYLWPYRANSATMFNEIRNSWFSDRGNIVLNGPGIASGNHISRNEIVGFHYRPSQHSNQTWAHPTDAQVQEARRDIVQRAGVEIREGGRPEGSPDTLLARGWNVIDRNLIVDGRTGIFLARDARHTILNRNIIDVTGEAFVNEGSKNIDLRSFSADEVPAPTPPPVELQHVGKAGHRDDANPTNLAAGKPVISSSGMPASRAAAFTDSSIDGDVAGAAAPEFLMVDLGRSTTLSRIQLWHHHRDKRSYNGVIVQISNDPAFVDGVITLFNNDATDEAGQGRGTDPRYLESPKGLTIDFPPTKARFIRCWLNGNDQNMYNHWREVKAFGPG